MGVCGKGGVSELVLVCIFVWVYVNVNVCVYDVCMAVRD